MVEGFATRAGVFEYMLDDGSVQREFRPSDEVGAPESLATLARKPITNNHPQEFVDSQNAHRHTVGLLDGEVDWVMDFEDGFVRVRGTVVDGNAIESMDRGRAELSCGYTADLDPTPGIFVDAAGTEHEYDAVQRNIRYNHLALVDRGRAGSKVRLRLDHGAGVRVDRVMAPGNYTVALRDAEWDADEAEGRVRDWTDAEDGPNRAYARAFLWVDEANADRFIAYKLQYADVRGDKLMIIPRAVFAIAAALQGARGGVDVPDSDMPALRDAVGELYRRMREIFEDPQLLPPWEESDDEGAQMADGNEEEMKDALSDVLNEAIEAMVSEDMTRAEIIAAMAQAAGIETSTVNQILNGEIERPPDERLRGFAQVLNISLETLQNELPEETTDNHPQQELLMSHKTITVDGRHFGANEHMALQRAVADLAKRADSAEKELAKKNAQVLELNNRVKKYQALADAQNKSDADENSAEKFVAYANQRIQLIDMARAMKLDGYEDISKVTASNDDIKKAIVTSHFDGDENPNLDDATYVDAVFDYLVRKGVKSSKTDSLADSLNAQVRNRADRASNDETSLTKAQDAYMARFASYHQNETHSQAH